MRIFPKNLEINDVIFGHKGGFVHVFAACNPAALNRDVTFVPQSIALKPFGDINGLFCLLVGRRSGITHSTSLLCCFCRYIAKLTYHRHDGIRTFFRCSAAAENMFVALIHNTLSASR